MKRSKVLGLLAGILGLAGMLYAAGTQYPYFHMRYMGMGSKNNTEQFSINTPSAGASAVFTPGVTNTNALGSTSLRFSNVFTTLLNTSGAATIGGAATVTGVLTVGSMASTLGIVVATQTIAAAGTVAADACGSFKRISSAGVVTSSTTDTFTTPTAALEGCRMDVCNVGSNNITLDNNTNFKSIGGADIVLTPDDCTAVAFTGGAWRSVGSLVAN